MDKYKEATQGSSAWGRLHPTQLQEKMPHELCAHTGSKVSRDPLGGQERGGSKTQ